MNICIFDDETYAMNFLKFQLEQVKDITKHNVIFSTGKADMSGKEKLLDNIDLVFLDVEMQGESGLDLLDQLTTNYPEISIVVVTAHERYAIQAFEFSVFDYILKPVELRRLTKTLLRFQNTKTTKTINSSTQTLSIKTLEDLSFKLSEDYEYQTLKWRTAKSKELFLYLLQQREKLVLKSELIENIWNNHQVEKGLSHLYVSVYYIRQTITPYADFIKIMSINDGYKLVTKNVKLFRMEWIKDIKNLPQLSDKTINIYQDTLNKYDGGYLEKENYNWSESERYKFESVFVCNAQKIGDYFYEKGAFESATEWYFRVVELTIGNEEVIFKLMKIYDKRGYGVLVDFYYKKLLNQLDELNISVNPEIETWFCSRKKTNQSYRKLKRKI